MVPVQIDDGRSSSSWMGRSDGISRKGSCMGHAGGEVRLLAADLALYTD